MAPKADAFHKLSLRLVGFFYKLHYEYKSVAKDLIAVTGILVPGD